MKSALILLASFAIACTSRASGEMCTQQSMAARFSTSNVIPLDYGGESWPAISAALGKVAYICATIKAEGFSDWPTIPVQIRAVQSLDTDFQNHIEKLLSQTYDAGNRQASLRTKREQLVTLGVEENQIEGLLKEFHFGVGVETTFSRVELSNGMVLYSEITTDLSPVHVDPTHSLISLINSHLSDDAAATGKDTNSFNIRPEVLSQIRLIDIVHSHPIPSSLSGGDQAIAQAFHDKFGDKIVISVASDFRSSNGQVVLFSAVNAGSVK